MKEKQNSKSSRKNLQSCGNKEFYYEILTVVIIGAIIIPLGMIYADDILFFINKVFSVAVDFIQQILFN